MHIAGEAAGDHDDEGRSVIGFAQQYVDVTKHALRTIAGAKRARVQIKRAAGCEYFGCASTRKSVRDP